jgi:hypothetical protein
MLERSYHRLLPATEFQGHDPSNKNVVFCDFMTNVGGNRSVKIVMEKTPQAARLVPDASLDICFIDANHRYADVKAGIEAWEPKVKRSGLLCDHDCERLPPPRAFTAEELASNYVDGMHCGVIQAVWERYGDRAEVRPDYGIYGTPIWVVRL